MDDPPRRSSEPPTRPTNEAPVPTILEVYRRQEDLFRVIAELTAAVETLPVAMSVRFAEMVRGLEEQVNRLIANVEVCRGEEQRHGGDIAQLRSDLDAHLFRSGANGGVPGG